MANQPAMISLRPEQKAEQNHQKSIRMGPQPLTVFNLTRIRPAVIRRMFGIYKEKWVFLFVLLGEHKLKNPAGSNQKVSLSCTAAAAEELEIGCFATLTRLRSSSLHKPVIYGANSPAGTPTPGDFSPCLIKMWLLPRCACTDSCFPPCSCSFLRRMAQLAQKFRLNM